MVFAGSSFHKGLLFLLQLAWDCRFRLPLLITIGFMVLDVRMQIEINIDVDQRNIQEGEFEETEDEFTSGTLTDTDDDFTSTYETESGLEGDERLGRTSNG